MKKIIFILLVLINLNVAIFAETTYRKGIDINLNDIGVSLMQQTNRWNIKATASYPLFAILMNSEKIGQVPLDDYFETIALHGTINYNLIKYQSFFLNLGFASDVFMQFDFSNEHSHYTCFTIGVYGEVGWIFTKDNKEDLYLSLGLNLPFIAMENKPTNFWNGPPNEEAWNELIDYNDSVMNMIFMVYKLNFTIPF